ncbi:MAG: LysM peptidoglycan-binding domain-containing protein [Candidatus Dormibacteraeota bacterium]|nr:LysM peptidoglycan-binding domain-containing protein [Candidatus Dormibacteraeota bacterium]
MYATGYPVRPLSSSHRAPWRHFGRWAAVVLAVICMSAGLSKVALGDARQVDITVVVQPGDTLWGIAAARYPGDDVRVRVDEIERLNGLHTPTIVVGEVLRLPA